MTQSYRGLICQPVAFFYCDWPAFLFFRANHKENKIANIHMYKLPSASIAQSDTNPLRNGRKVFHLGDQLKIDSTGTFLLRRPAELLSYNNRRRQKRELGSLEIAADGRSFISDKSHNDQSCKVCQSNSYTAYPCDIFNLKSSPSHSKVQNTFCKKQAFNECLLFASISAQISPQPYEAPAGAEGRGPSCTRPG